MRTLALEEKVAIEDRLFDGNKEQRLGEQVTSIVLADVTKYDLDEFATVCEFAISLVATSGFQTISHIAVFDEHKCVEAKSRAVNFLDEASIPESVDGDSFAQWVHVCFLARQNLGDRMHVTADRFGRYVRNTNLADALLDLCISLESLMESTTEIAFRFSVSLAKVSGDKGSKAEESYELLKELYGLRSKIAHGDPDAKKLLAKIQPKLVQVRNLSRKVLTVYVLFMSKNEKAAWKNHLQKSILA